MERKRINIYTTFGANNIYTEGYVLSAGNWIDVIYFLDWLENAVQTNIVNLLVSSPNKIPQTSAGISAIKNVVEAACVEGVRNGGIAPGQLSEALKTDVEQSIGIEFDGFLSTGYLVYIMPISEQSQVVRNERASPPVRVWLKGSGAIHSVETRLTFEN